MLNFNKDEVLAFKAKHPDLVIFIADASKNPQSFMGAWGAIKTQTADDLVKLLDRAEASEKEATNAGVRTGLFSLFGADFEWSWVYRIWAEQMGERGETLTILTPNGGKRPVFFTMEVERDWGEPYKKNLRFEFKINGYVALWGHATDILGKPAAYKVIKDLPIKTDNKIMQDTYNVLRDLLSKTDFLEYRCIQAGLDKKMRMNHEQRLAILSFMVKNKWPDLAIHNFFKDVHETEGACDYKASVTQSQIHSGRSFIEGGGKPHPCKPKKYKDSNKVSTPLYEIFTYDSNACRGCPRKSSHKKGDSDSDEGVVYRYKPCVKGPDFLAEMIWDGKSAPRYVVAHPDAKEFSYTEEVDLGETDDKGRRIVYRPPYNDHLTKGMVLVPLAPLQSTFEEVTSEAFSFVLNPSHYDSCGRDNYVKLITLIAMGSWFLDRMEPKTVIPIAGVGRYAPIIPIRGASESGKNRLANLLRFVAYHPFFDLSKSKVPSMFRPLDTWGGTCIIDEGDMKKSGSTAEVIQFLNSRATGTPISRQNPEHVSESQAFESFGQTILTQRQHFDDNATESRSVPFYSQKTMTRLPTVELDDMVEQGLKIQNKLLYLRLKHWFTFNIDKSRWHPKISDHRLNASLLPVYTLADYEPSVSKLLDSLVVSIEATKRKIKAVSMDGQVINHLFELLESDGPLWDQHNGIYYILKKHEILTDSEGAETEKIEVLTVSAIAESLGFGSKTVRKILDSLGVAPEEAPARIRVRNRTVRPVWFDPYRLEKQLQEFVVDYQHWSLYNHLGIKPPESVTLVTDVTLPTVCEVITPPLHRQEESKTPPVSCEIIFPPSHYQDEKIDDDEEVASPDTGPQVSHPSQVSPTWYLVAKKAANPSNAADLVEGLLEKAPDKTMVWLELVEATGIKQGSLSYILDGDPVFNIIGDRVTLAEVPPDTKPLTLDLDAEAASLVLDVDALAEEVLKALQGKPMTVNEAALYLAHPRDDVRRALRLLGDRVNSVIVLDPAGKPLRRWRQA